MPHHSAAGTRVAPDRDMEAISRQRRTAAARAVTVLVLVASACADESGTELAPAEPAPPDQISAADPIYEQTPDIETLPESRIYHTLTDHEWYARAEPLRHEGAPYQPAGLPIVASLAEMEHVGE
jgi:hypothetical protein